MLGLTETQAPSHEELIANLEYATKLLGAFPILRATAQVQHLLSVVERATTPSPDLERLSGGERL